MKTDELQTRWREESHQVIAAIVAWREEHPTATFQEIESAIDDCLARLRAHMLEDAALASDVADLRDKPAQKRPPCPVCGTPVKHHARDKRTLLTQHNQQVTLERSYAVCPKCGETFFPLDEELALLPGPLTPSIQKAVTRLGARLPFPQAEDELHAMWQVDISATTVRRQAETAGAAYVAVQTAQVDRLERELPPSPPGPDLQQMSVDGAMVPLLHKQWGEVRTLALGVVERPVIKNGEVEVHTGQLSYFSRLCDAETFTRLATVETHRRGTETAGKVCAVADGAEWEQGFVDVQRSDAVRILDFSHAAEHVSAAGQVVYGEGTDAFQQWFTAERHELKHGQPQTVIADVRRLGESDAGGETGRAIIDGAAAYLEKRIEQMRYAQFVAQGYPIGSGIVESGHKVVIEARLKGAGMHWAPEHVNPMSALRTIICSNRWDEEWPLICQQLRLTAREDSRERRRQRQTKDAQAHAQAMLAQPIGQTVTDTPTPSHPGRVQQTEPEPSANSPKRPGANHPWRHSPVGRARYQRSQQAAAQKT